MKNKPIKYLFLLLGTLSIFSFDIPLSWYQAGSHPECYNMGIDPNVQYEGKKVVTIKSIKKTKGFGTLMQSCLADKYLGKRIKMTGFVKSQEVKGWAGLWLRVDKQNDVSEVLGFDNMSNRPIKGTSDWKKYEIVMVIPANAYSIAYGSLLVGQGQIWFSNISFEIVSDSIPTTHNDCKVCSKILNEPSNLNFEK